MWERKRILRTYGQTYLKEEIAAETAVKNTESFARFLVASSQFAGRYLDLSKLAKLSKVPRQTVVRHFQVLEDTLLVQTVYPDPELLADNVDLVKHPRFYYFDTGVLNALLGSFELSADRAGPIFEHFVFNQVRNAALSQEKTFEAFNLRTRGGFEVDFIFKIDGVRFAVECKSGTDYDEKSLSNLAKTRELYRKVKPILIYRGKRSLSRDGIAILPLNAAIRSMVGE